MSRRDRRARKRRNRELGVEQDRQQRLLAVRVRELRLRAQVCPVQLWAARLPAVHGAQLGHLIIRTDQEVHT